MSTADLEPDGLYHLIAAADWDTAQASGVIAPASIAEEGFVHCSWGGQVPGTLAKHFPGRTDLSAVLLDPAALTAPLVAEDLYGSGQAFPHVYGPIPVAAVVGVVPLD